MNTNANCSSAPAPLGVKLESLSSATFVFYTFFLFDFFLHLSSRIPGLGVLRPTLLLVLVIFGLLASQSKILKRRHVSEISLAMKALIIYLIISLPFITFPGSVVKVNIAIFLKAIVFFYFTAAIVDSPKRLKLFLIIFVGCQVFRILEPLFLNITTGYWGSSTYIGGGEFASRLSGAPHDVINPNELGFVIVTAIPFLHYLLLPRGWFYKLVYAGLMACLVYALILTMSRGAFLALLVVAWMIFKKSNKKVLLVVFGLVGVMAAWSVMTPLQKDRYISLVDSDAKGAKTTQGRFKGMTKEFELGFHRPIFGHGLGTTGESKYHYFGIRQASHNMYAEVLIEIGLLGMFFFGRFISSVYREIKKIETVISESNIESQRLKDVLISLFWMYAVYSINYWGLSQSYWYLLAGLTVAYLRIVHMQKGNDLYSELIEGKRRV